MANIITIEAPDEIWLGVAERIVPEDQGGGVERVLDRKYIRVDPKTGCRKSPTTECRRLWTVRGSPRGPPAISCNPGVSSNSRNGNGPPSEPIFEPWHSSRTRQPPPTVETAPDITRLACTLRVIRDPPPTARTTC